MGGKGGEKNKAFQSVIILPLKIKSVVRREKRVAMDFQWLSI